MNAAGFVVTDGPRHFAAAPTGPAARDVRALESSLWRSEAERALREGDTRLALRCWQVVRQFEPTAPDVLFRLGCCHALVGEAVQAGRAFGALTRMHAAPSDLRRRAARLMLLVGPEPD